MSYKKIKSFADACIAVGTTEEQFNQDYSGIKNVDTLNYERLKIIAKALNGKWEPDWIDRTQYKHTPYFIHKSGFGLSYYDLAYWSTIATVGSRLCYKTAELAKYAATQFADIYNDFLTIK